MLAYRSPEGARGAEVRDDLVHGHHGLIADAPPEDRRVLTGRPRRDRVFYCEDCGQEVTGGAVANAAYWAGARRTLCDECAQAGQGADGA